MGADDSGLADSSALEAILMGLLADALALKEPDERSVILDRILAGEKPITVELSGGQVLVFLFGEQMAVRSMQWFLTDPAQPGP